MPLREQQSGLVKKGHYARQLPPLTQQQLIAAARRQAAYEGDLEASHHRVGHSAGIHSEDQPYLTGDMQQGRVIADEYKLEEGDEYYNTRPPTSTRRYQGYEISPEHVYQQGNTRLHVRYVDVPPRKSRQAQLPPGSERHTDEYEVKPGTNGKKRTWKIHPLLYLGVGMIAMLALFVLLSSAVSWLQEKQNDVTYGRPRTFQIDAVVGHNDSSTSPSHFTAINLNRHVEVIEWPGQDSSKMKVYQITTLFGDGEDLTPVTLSFRDVNGDGKPDMLIHIENQTLVMINDNGTFRPAKAGEVKGIL